MNDVSKAFFRSALTGLGFVGGVTNLLMAIYHTNPYPVLTAFCSGLCFAIAPFAWLYLDPFVEEALESGTVVIQNLRRILFEVDPNRCGGTTYLYPDDLRCPGCKDCRHDEAEREAWRKKRAKAIDALEAESRLTTKESK